MLGVFAATAVTLAAPAAVSAAGGTVSTAIGISGTSPDPVGTCTAQAPGSFAHTAGCDTSAAADDVVLRVGDYGSVVTNYTTSDADTTIRITQTLPLLPDGTPSGIWRAADPGCSPATGLGTPTLTCGVPNATAPTAYAVTNTFQLSQRALDGTTVTVGTSVTSASPGTVTPATPVTFVASAGSSQYRIGAFSANQSQRPYKDPDGNIGVLQWMGVEIANQRTGGTSAIYGNQAPATPISFSLDLSNVAGVRLMNWGSYGNGCGHNTRVSAFPNAGQANSAVDYGMAIVTDNGPITCTQAVAGGPITVSIASPPDNPRVNLPTQPVIERAWIALWVPSADTLANYGVTMTPGAFTTSSVADQPITGTPTAGTVTGTNDVVPAAGTPGNKIVVTRDANPAGSLLSNNGATMTTCGYPSWPGQCAMTLATAGGAWPPAAGDPALTYTVNVPIGNYGTKPWIKPVVCDKWDRMTTLLTGAPLVTTNQEAPTATDYGLFGPYSPSGTYDGTTDFTVAPAGYTIEYGVTAALTSPAAITNLNCSDPSIQYFDSVAAAGGASQVNVVRLTLTGDLAPSQQVALKLDFQAQLAYNGGPTAGQPVGPNVLMADSMTYRKPDGTWQTFGNRGAITPGFPEMRYDVRKSVAGAGNPAVGSTLTYTITSGEYFGYDYGADTPYRIIDKLAPGTTYVPGSASEAPTAVLPQADGSTALLWDRVAVYPGSHTYSQRVANPDITFQVTLSTLTPNGTPIDNQVQVWGILPDGTRSDPTGVVYCYSPHVPVTIPPTAAYPAGFEVTFPPAGLQSGCGGYWKHYWSTIQVASNPLVLAVDKSVAAPQIEPGGSNTYQLTYRNLQGGALASTDLIDVLPFDGDGRTPASDFAGTITLSGAPTIDVPAGSTFSFTSRTPAQIVGDPADPSNQGGGATVWCAEADFGTVGCPQDWPQVTALRVTGGSLGSGEQRTVTVPVLTTGNAAGNVYSNTAAIRSPSVPSVVSSTTATFTAVTSIVRGTLFNDPNADGVVGAGESGRYAGVTVTLRDGSGAVVDVTQTDAGGTYSFGELAAGDYTVAVDLSTAPAGMAGLFPAARATSPAGASKAVTVGIGATAGADFGFLDASLALTKNVAESTYGIGTVLHYTFTVTNTGQGAVTGLTVSDALAGVTAPSCAATTLAPGDGTTCTATYTTAQADIDAGAVTNTATASATLAVGGAVTSAPATTTVTTTQTSGITITKSTTSTLFDGAGDVIDYAFVVANTGNVSIDSIAITDPLVATVSCPATTLAGGASMICSGSYTTVQGDVDAGRVVNTAGVTARSATGQALNAASNEVTVPALQTSQLSIVKASTKASVSAVDEQIPYTFTVTNLGTVTIHGLAVSDPIVATVTCPVTVLAPGAQTVCTGTHLTTQTDLDVGHVDNVATASGLDPGDVTVSTTSAQVVVPALHRPALHIVKATTSTRFTTLGEQIPYTFTVTNTGNVTIDDIAVTDPKVGDVTCPVAVLSPGAATTCTGIYEVVQGDLDAGVISNQASVEGSAPSAQPVGPVTSNQVIISAIASPAIAVVKSTTAAFYDTVGQEIPYSFTVTNTGNVTLTNVAVTDPTLDDGFACAIAELAAGAQAPCSGTHTVTAADLDAGQLVNVASVTADVPAASPPLPPTSSNTVVVPAIYRPELSIVKSSTTIVLTAAGQVVPYTFTVVNTGNVTIDGIDVGDPLLAGVTCPVTTLAIGEQTTCEGDYTASQADVDAGLLLNQATVDGEVPNGAPALTPAVSNEVEILADQQPVLTLTKSADTAQLTAAGQVVTYSFVVANGGNTTLDGVVVDDPMVPAISCPASTVAPGATLTCSGTYAVTQADLDAGRVTNTATVTAQTPQPVGLVSLTAVVGPVTSNTVVIEALQQSALTVVKATSSTLVSAVGEQVPFTFVVTNTGNTTLTGVVVTDAKVPSVTCPATTLAPGESTTCTATYTVTQADVDAGRVTNVASVRATDPGGAVLPDAASNEVQVPYVPPPPAPAPPTPATPTPGQLPATGSSGTPDVLLIATVLLLAGGVLTVAVRRRRRLTR